MEKIDLTGKTKVGDLLQRYPSLINYLPQLSPEYVRLKNPVLRRAMSKVATLRTVAKMGGLELDDLLSKIQKEIERIEGERNGKPDPTSSEGGEQAERKRLLKEILLDLDRGVDIEILKERFSRLIQDIDASEIAELEQALIDDGMPEAKIKELCDLHVSIFRQSLDRKEKTSTLPGHPVHTFMMENREAEKILADLIILVDQLEKPPQERVSEDYMDKLSNLLDRLSQIDKHYLRKENQLFPVLEAHGMSGPSQVMWALHDDIRLLIKKLRSRVAGGELTEVPSLTEELVRMIRDMIYKEEHILYPMSLENLTDQDWLRVGEGEGEIGYAWVKPGGVSSPKPEAESEGPRAEASTPETVSPEKEVSEVEVSIALETGVLSPDQINIMLKNLPIDISFVDEKDEVVYYSAGKDRIFPRSPGVIGRKVQKCHPPKSVHIVNEILERFRAGEEDVSEFWIELAGRFIHIRYVAVRDSQGRYRGTMEITQDVTEIRKLEGEKRLLDWSRLNKLDGC